MTIEAATCLYTFSQGPRSLPIPPSPPFRFPLFVCPPGHITAPVILCQDGHTKVFRGRIRKGPYGREEACGVRDPGGAHTQAPFRIRPNPVDAEGDEPLLRGGAQQDLSGALGARARRVGGA